WRAPIVGGDVRRDAGQCAAPNARTAGLGKLVPFSRADVRDFRPPDGPPGTLLVNPPYGERIGDERGLVDLYRTLGEVFRRVPGWRAWGFTGNEELSKRVGVSMAAQVPLFNGRIPCKLIRYENDG